MIYLKISLKNKNEFRKFEKIKKKFISVQSKKLDANTRVFLKTFMVNLKVRTTCKKNAFFKNLLVIKIG